jgi:hypothetical protein
MADTFGDFLTAYEEYLDGRRDYQDLPPFPSAHRDVAESLVLSNVRREPLGVAAKVSIVRLPGRLRCWLRSMFGRRVPVARVLRR